MFALLAGALCAANLALAQPFPSRRGVNRDP
jgi:hypothetical protein